MPYNVGVPRESASPIVAASGPRPAVGPRPALTARWTNLILLTYRAPTRLLRPCVHPSLELDTWDGETHVSLVAFDFENTRIHGIRIPGFVDFPEVNLRTYVRRGDERGVVFIRELVPSRLIALVARLWYNEPYLAVPMQSTVQRTPQELVAARRWMAGGVSHSVVTRAGHKWVLPPPGSSTDHFKEQTWGFGRDRSGRLLRYRVEHPPWTTLDLQEGSVEVDFGRAYGPDWTFLGRETPISTIWAVGSEVAVYPARRERTV